MGRVGRPGRQRLFKRRLTQSAPGSAPPQSPRQTGGRLAPSPFLRGRAGGGDVRTPSRRPVRTGPGQHNTTLLLAPACSPVLAELRPARLTLRTALGYLARPSSSPGAPVPLTSPARRMAPGAEGRLPGLTVPVAVARGLVADFYQSAGRPAALLHAPTSPTAWSATGA